MKKRVLFLCTGNSCRSQMAEGLVNHRLAGRTPGAAHDGTSVVGAFKRGDEWEAYSAGTMPAGYVHPLAIQVMAELGIDISRQRSKPAEEFRGQEFDLVVTVCDDAAENCPVWLERGRKAHLSFPDPARATGSEEERLAAFRGVRDAMRGQVFALLKAS